MGATPVSWYRPAGHGKQELVLTDWSVIAVPKGHVLPQIEAPAALTRPIPHAVHVALEFAPIMAEEVPGEHGMHSPALKYRPLLHAASHDETLNPQGTHALSLRDAEVTPKPTGQLPAQAVALYALTSPGPQAAHLKESPL